MADRPRIDFLDALRGLGVMGILAVNAAFMAATFDQAVDPRAWPFPNDGASLALWVVKHVVFENKFITLFALLFGVSTWLVGGEPGDAGRRAILLRRFGALAVVGLLHGAFVWYGDVLLDYAACGLLAMAVRGWPAGRLVAAGVGGFLAGLVLMTVGPAVPAVAAWIEPHGVPAAAAFQGSFGDSLAANFAAWRAYRPLLVFYTWPYCAPLMLLGLGLFKGGFLAGRAGPRANAAAMLAGAAALAALGASTAAVVRGGFAHDLGAVRDEFLLLVTGPFVALGYVAALAASSRTRAGGGIVRTLAPLGRMAFTNYLAQSVLMTGAFYGGRGPGGFGHVDRPALALVVVAVWALQLAWSHAWLRRFEAGPLEWAWRCATHWRLLPLRRRAD